MSERTFNGDWIQTYTGRKFWPLSPRGNDVDIMDIAHALAMKCRFTGHCRSFYSVAQHSVLVSYVVAQMGGSAEAQLYGLLHDAAEAYLPDIAQPIKGAFAIWAPVTLEGDRSWLKFKEVESLIIGAVYNAIGLPAPGVEAFEVVKRADVVMLMTEARDLMGEPPEAWQIEPEFMAEQVDPLPSELAKSRFLSRFSTLRRAMTGGVGTAGHEHHRATEGAAKPS